MNNEIKIFIDSSKKVISKITELSIKKDDISLFITNKLFDKLNSNLEIVLNSISKRKNENFLKRLIEFQNKPQPDINVKLIQYFDELFDLIEEYGTDDDLNELKK